MKKFKVRYYEIVVNHKRETYFNEAKEDIIEATGFFFNQGVIFLDNSNNNIAFYPDVISVKEMKDE